MVTANSISGGRTSAYIEANYPADVSVFALVCVDDHNCAGKLKLDKKLVQMANDRLQKTSSHWGEFIATTEDPIILNTIFDLEQFTGREITWVRGMSWEQMMNQKQAIPNMAKRFCSHIMKITPIFEYLYLNNMIPCEMRIGYRYDEMERVETLTDTFDFPYKCEYRGEKLGWQHRWKEIQWRNGSFPLVEDKILHHHVQSFWKDKNVRFAEDSNCQNCFWKQPQQLRKNFDTNPAIMKWGGVQEAIRGNTFKENRSLFQIAQDGIQLDFIFGGGSGCQAGFCTD